MKIPLWEVLEFTYRTKSAEFTAGASESDFCFILLIVSDCFRFVLSDSEKAGCAVLTEITGNLKAILV